VNEEAEEEISMPHVMVKLWPGKSEQQKVRRAEAITKTSGSFNYEELSVSGSDGRSLYCKELSRNSSGKQFDLVIQTDSEK
jgi:hypothetical protein